MQTAESDVVRVNREERRRKPRAEAVNSVRQGRRGDVARGLYIRGLARSSEHGNVQTRTLRLSASMGYWHYLSAVHVTTMTVLDRPEHIHSLGRGVTREMCTRCCMFAKQVSHYSLG
jgi:hypothetical protein